MDLRRAALRSSPFISCFSIMLSSIGVDVVCDAHSCRSIGLGVVPRLSSAILAQLGSSYGASVEEYGLDVLSASQSERCSSSLVMSYRESIALSEICVLFLVRFSSHDWMKP